MAQPNFEEKLEIEKLHIESTDVMTGDRNKSRFLLYQLKLSMAQAKQIDIIVSFLMESGVRMLLKDLKAALDRGVRIRILTGNYLGKIWRQRMTFGNIWKRLKFICGDIICTIFFMEEDRKSTRLNSSHFLLSRMPSSA